MTPTQLLAMIPAPPQMYAQYSVADGGYVKNLIVGFVASDDGNNGVAFTPVEMNNSALALTPSSGAFQKIVIGG